MRVAGWLVGVAGWVVIDRWRVEGNGFSLSLVIFIPLVWESIDNYP